MARKRYTTVEIIRKLREADVLIGQGQTVADDIRHLGGADVTYYRWRKEYGGLKADQAKRFKVWGIFTRGRNLSVCSLAHGSTPIQSRS